MIIKKISSKITGKIFPPLLFSSLCLCLFSAHAAFFIGMGLPIVGHATLERELSSKDPDDINMENIAKAQNAENGEAAIDIEPGVDFQFGIDLSKISIRTPFRLSANMSMLGSDERTTTGGDEQMYPKTKTTIDFQYLLPVTKTETIAVGGYIGKEKWEYRPEQKTTLMSKFTFTPVIRGVSIALIAQIDGKGSAIEVGYKKTLFSSTVKKDFQKLPVKAEFRILHDDMFYIHYIYSFGPKSESEDI